MDFVVNNPRTIWQYGKVIDFFFFFLHIKIILFLAKHYMQMQSELPLFTPLKTTWNKTIIFKSVNFF